MNRSRDNAHSGPKEAKGRDGREGQTDQRTRRERTAEARGSDREPQTATTQRELSPRTKLHESEAKTGEMKEVAS